MIRTISVSVGFCLVMGAVLPGAGCASSEPPRDDSANRAGESGSSAATAGSAAQPSAGAATTQGAAGADEAQGVGGAGSLGGAASRAGAANAGASGSVSGAATGCDAPGLVWKSANKTNYTSYPEPGSDECVKFSGCLYEGLFEACQKKQTLDWVKAHNIVAAFPLGDLELHDLCLKAGDKTIVVTVFDTCGDDDCGGCCTENKGNKDELIDVESFTDQRFGVDDGPIQWADLGPTQNIGCAD